MRPVDRVMRDCDQRRLSANLVKRVLGLGTCSVHRELHRSTLHTIALRTEEEINIKKKQPHIYSRPTMCGHSVLSASAIAAAVLVHFCITMMQMVVVECTPHPEPERPRRHPRNILFIVCDDLRPALQSYGDHRARTPHIDRLAADGFVFTHAYAQVKESERDCLNI